MKGHPLPDPHARGSPERTGDPHSQPPQPAKSLARPRQRCPGSAGLRIERPVVHARIAPRMARDRGYPRVETAAELQVPKHIPRHGVFASLAAEAALAFVSEDAVEQ